MRSIITHYTASKIILAGFRPEFTRQERGCLKSKKFKHRGTEVWSYTEKLKLEPRTLCNSVSPYLRVEIFFETTSFSLLFYHAPKEKVVIIFAQHELEKIF